MKILIIDEMHESIIPMLESNGHEVSYQPLISRAEILNQIEEYHGLIIRSKTPMNRELLEKAVNLKFIGRAGAGLDQIDLDYLKERGVALFMLQRETVMPLLSMPSEDYWLYLITLKKLIRKFAWESGIEKGTVVMSSKVKPSVSWVMEIWARLLLKDY